MVRGLVGATLFCLVFCDLALAQRGGEVMLDDTQAPVEAAAIADEFVGLRVESTEAVTVPFNKNNCDDVGTIPTYGYYPAIVNPKAKYYRDRDIGPKTQLVGTWNCSVDYEDRQVPNFSPTNPLCYDYGVICTDEDGLQLLGIRCLTNECGTIRSIE